MVRDDAASVLRQRVISTSSSDMRNQAIVTAGAAVASGVLQAVEPRHDCIGRLGTSPNLVKASCWRPDIYLISGLQRLALRTSPNDSVNVVL